MADDTPTESATLPNHEPTIALRRGFAFLLDLGLLSIFTGVVWNLVTAPLSGVVQSFLDDAITFGWWSSSWLAGGRTPGMLITGLELRDAMGARLPRAAHLRRAAFLTFVYAPVVVDLLGALSGDQWLPRLYFFWRGLGLGYAGYAAFALRRPGNVWLPHDQWAGAGVFRVGRAVVSPFALPVPASKRQALIAMVLAAAFLLVLSGRWDNNLDVRRSMAVARYFQRQLAAERGFHTDVIVGDISEQKYGSGRVRWLQLRVRIPWAAFSMKEDMPLADSLVDRFVAEINRAHLDVERFDGVRIIVECSLSGALPLSMSMSKEARFLRHRSTDRSSGRDSL